MKKSLIIFIVSFFCVSIFAEDACYEAYLKALQDYNKGNYIEALGKFVVVAQTCGNDYPDVWKKMRDCNIKLATIQNGLVEKQKQLSADIASLKSDKKQLASEKEKNESELKKQIFELKGEVIGQKKVIKQGNDSIALLNGTLNQLQDSVSSLNGQLKNLENRFDSVNQVLSTTNLQVLELLSEKAKTNKKVSKKVSEQTTIVQEDKREHIPEIPDTITAKVPQTLNVLNQK